MVNNRTIKAKWRTFWGQFHNDGENTCVLCGHPAYKRWDKKYNGYLGFCTECDYNWRES